MEDPDDYCDSIHAYPLTDSAGRTALMCWSAQQQGQAGPALTWLGVFRDEAALREACAEVGLVLGDARQVVTDPVILGLWSASHLPSNCHIR